MKDVEGAGFAGSSPFRGRKREAVDVDAGPDQVRSPAALATMKPVLLAWRHPAESRDSSLFRVLLRDEGRRVLLKAGSPRENVGLY